MIKVKKKGAKLQEESVKGRDGTAATRDEFSELIRMLVSALSVLLVVWAAFTFFLGVLMVQNDDMSPRISAGDVLVYYRVDRDPKAQDVIVLEKNDTKYVGRVIAAGGDKVEITVEDALIVNGNMVIEDKIFYSTPYYEGFLEYPLTLEADEYFVLSDMRNGGEDSRYYGPVKKSEINGVVIGQFRKSGI